MRTDIPLAYRLELKDLLNELRRGVPGTIERFAPMPNHGLYALMSGNYAHRSTQAAVWMSVRYLDSFEGLVHVVADFTSGAREFESAQIQAEYRVMHGERFETHDVH